MVNGGRVKRKKKEYSTVLVNGDYAYKMVNRVLYQAHFNNETLEVIDDFLPIDSDTIMGNKELLSIYLALFM